MLNDAPIAALSLDIAEIGIVTCLLTWDIMYLKMTTGTFFKLASWIWMTFFISTLGVTSPVSPTDTRILQTTMGGVAIVTYVQLLLQAHIASNRQHFSVPRPSPQESTSATVRQWEKRRKLATCQYIVYALMSVVYVITWAIGPSFARLVTRKWYIEISRITVHVPLMTVATWLSMCSHACGTGC
jgi:energy-converting hydrogenase Eha subunit E